MDILSIVFAQLFVLLALVAIGGVIYFAYQANLQQQQKTRGRGGEKKERKQPKKAATPEPEPEPEADPEPEPEPEPVVEEKKPKKNKNKKAEEPKPVEKPQAKPAPAKKAAQKAAPQQQQQQQQQPAKAAAKKAEEKKEPAKAEQKAKKDDKDKKKKQLQQQHQEHEAQLATIQKKVAKPAAVEAGWSEVTVKRPKGKEKDEKKAGQPSKNVITLRIDSKHFPAIIGQKGAVLTTIQTVTKTQITLPKDKTRTGDQNVTIEGGAKDCEYAEALITELIEKGYTSVTHPDVKAETLRLSNPAKDRGLIVGTKGESIRALQTGTKVRINLPYWKKREKGEDGEKKRGDSKNDEPCPDYITIVGKDSDVLRAREAIATLLSEGFSTVTHPNYVRGEVEVPHEQRGLLMRNKAEAVREIQKATKTQIKVPSLADTNPVVTIIGVQENVEAARQKILALVNVTPEPIEEDNPNNPWAAVNVTSADGEW